MSPPPEFGLARVLPAENPPGLPEDVFILRLGYVPQKSADGGSKAALPLPGRFYMLRPEHSAVLLGRPISLFFAEQGGDSLVLEFLIGQKGAGTGELRSLPPGSGVVILGPLGNGFPPPGDALPGAAGKKLLLIGGGLGIGPVAGFAGTLPDGAYDLWACFRSRPYGLHRVKPGALTVVTEDGSAGLRGALGDALGPEILLGGGYTGVYACGPEPMLAFVRDLCRRSALPCFLSMENRMACGMGVCLGCVIRTTGGNRRCCADGPVFSGEELIFPQNPGGLQKPKGTPLPCPPDMSVRLGPLTLKNPVIAASGTFGYGREYAGLTDVTALGAVCAKGVTLEGSAGNGGVRLHETPGGLINSIGLENPGIAHFTAHELPDLLSYIAANTPEGQGRCRCIANLAGSSVESYVLGARLLDTSPVDAIELNISCPNVKHGGMSFGLAPGDAAAVTAAVRAATAKPLIVKLSPNAPDIVSVAHAVGEAGADALSLINTIQALAIDLETGRPVFDAVYAGLSGPAIKPIALRMVYDVVRSMKALPRDRRIPVIGIGGIASWQDAAEFLLAGAAAIEVGAATFANPRAMEEIITGLRSYMVRRGFASVDAMGQANA